MSADNFVAIVKEGYRKWVGYYCGASISYPFSDCFACIASKKFEVTTELKALHKAQMIDGLEYGYNFVGNHWMTPKEKQTLCPCETKRFITNMDT